MPAFFVFEQTADKGAIYEFTFQLNDQIKIAEARRIIADPTIIKSHVQGKIISTKAVYNPNWSFHLDPDTVSFFEFSTEVCDASAAVIETDLAKVGSSFLPNNHWCAWTSRPVREITLG